MLKKARLHRYVDIFFNAEHCGQGFTLIEILVVIGLLGIISVIAVTLFLQVLQNSNRSAVQIEVRQNAQAILSDMGSEIRKASCVCLTPVPVGSTMTLLAYSSKSDCSVCDPALATASFVSDVTSPDYRFTKNGSDVLSNKLAPCSNLGNSCSAACGGNGLDLLALGQSTDVGDYVYTTSPVQINLTIQQKPAVNLRSDFCGKVSLTDVFTPRN